MPSQQDIFSSSSIAGIDLLAYSMRNGPVMLCSSMMDGTCSCNCSQAKCATNGATCRGTGIPENEDSIQIDNVLVSIGLPF